MAYHEKLYERGGIGCSVHCLRMSKPKTDTTAALHYHDYAELVFVLSGVACAYIGDRRYTVSAGELCFAAVNEVHDVTSGAEDCEYIVVKFLPEIITNEAYRLPLFGNRGDLRRVFAACEFPEPGPSVMLFEILSEWERERLGYELALGAGIGRIYLSMLRAWEREHGEHFLTGDDSKCNSPLARAIQIAESEYSDITQGDAASRVGVSTSYLARVFRRDMKCTFSEYVKRIKIREAQRLLAGGDMTVTEIAEAVGFSTSAYFISEFRKAQGVTPSVYRKENSKRNRMNMNIEIPRGARLIIDCLNRAGHRADIVGGSVRDALLGMTPYDYDITTNAHPEQIKRIFSHLRTIDTGLQHGTVTVMAEDEAYEVTTYRIDGEYADNRHPSAVEFTDRIEDDLARRDFTVNAMAYSERHGLCDPYGGIEDLKARIIRAVGEAEVRFCEDALRILRAIRFSAKLGFSIEEGTRHAIYEKQHLLENVSKERIFIEFKKTIAGDFSHAVLNEYSEVFIRLFPELSGMRLPKERDYYSFDAFMRMLSLFYLNSTPSGYVAAMRRMKSDNKTINDGRVILDAAITLDRVGADAIKELYISERFDLLIAAARMLCACENAKAKDFESEFNELSSRGLPMTVSALDIRGDDIIALGVRGARVGEILHTLHSAVVFDGVKNERCSLINYATKLI